MPNRPRVTYRNVTGCFIAAHTQSAPVGSSVSTWIVLTRLVLVTGLV
jgi:hypothetical protein